MRDPLDCQFRLGLSPRMPPLSTSASERLAHAAADQPCDLCLSIFNRVNSVCCSSCRQCGAHLVLVFLDFSASPPPPMLDPSRRTLGAQTQLPWPLSLAPGSSRGCRACAGWRWAAPDDWQLSHTLLKSLLSHPLGPLLLAAVFFLLAPLGQKQDHPCCPTPPPPPSYPPGYKLSWGLGDSSF